MHKRQIHLLKASSLDQVEDELNQVMEYFKDQEFGCYSVLSKKHLLEVIESILSTQELELFHYENQDLFLNTSESGIIKITSNNANSVYSLIERAKMLDQKSYQYSINEIAEKLERLNIKSLNEVNLNMDTWNLGYSFLKAGKLLAEDYCFHRTLMRWDVEWNNKPDFVTYIKQEDQYIIFIDVHY